MACEFCGLEHGKICPCVRAIEYHANGKVKRVEFMRPADYYPWPLLTTPMSLPVPPIPLWPVTWNTGMPEADPWWKVGGIGYPVCAIS
jgi:hypothetical protein